MLSHNDAQLFHLIADGNEPAFARIYKTYTLPLYIHVKRITRDAVHAHDLVQEVFLLVWQKRKQLANVKNPAAWLHKVAGNVALNYLRQQQVADDEEAFMPYTTKTEQKLELAEWRRLVHSAVDGLPGQRQKVFRMYSEEGLSREEIAQQLGLSKNSVRNHLSLARASLQKYLVKHGGDTLPFVLLISLHSSL